MRYGIYTLDDLTVKGKIVLCRLDINEPVDKKKGKLKDTTRIQGSLETIRELADKGARTVLLAHQGSDVEYGNYYTLKLHAETLSSLLGKKINFVEDVCGPTAITNIKRLRDGDVLLLENVRFMAEEMTYFETKLNLTPQEQLKTQVVQKLAPLADIYVCDAFSAAHRAQPTLVALEEMLPSAMGRLFEKEYAILSGILENPQRPCVFILGGAKIQDAFLMMERVLKNNVADKVLTGGLVGNIMLTAAGRNLGAPSLDFLKKNNIEGYIDVAQGLLQIYKDRVLLPVDVAYVAEKRVEADVHALPVNYPIVDIGAKTVTMYVKTIGKAACIFANGPLGVFEEEQSEYGTRAVWQSLAEARGLTVLGGGDSLTAINKYNLYDRLTHVCTGGGALVRFLSGEELPVIAALKRSAKTFQDTR